MKIRENSGTTGKSASQSLLGPEVGDEALAGPALPVDAADEFNRDPILLSYVPALPLFDEEGVSNGNNIVS